MKDNDQLEWQELEREQAALLTGVDEETGRLYCAIATGCGQLGKPHPQSYRPDLPLRGLGLGKDKPTVKWPLTAAEKRAGLSKVVTPTKPVISKAKAHPQSYRPDLPLRGCGFNTPTDTRVWTLTADEKKQLAARPLRYVRAA